MRATTPARRTRAPAMGGSPCTMPFAERKRAIPIPPSTAWATAPARPVTGPPYSPHSCRCSRSTTTTRPSSMRAVTPKVDSSVSGVSTEHPGP